MGDYKPDWSAMSNDILANWIERMGCCEFIPEVVRRLRAERAAVPDRVVARGVFDELVTAMSSDNNVFFRAESKDYDRVLGAVESMVRAGYFRSDVLDLDGDYWQMAAGEETEKKEHFKDAPTGALATIDAVLNDIFDRPLPDVKRAAVPDVLAGIVNSRIESLHQLRDDVASGADMATVRSRIQAIADDLQYALTAAPQPPEGARVVDGEDEEPMQVARRQFADYFTKNYPGPDTVIFDPAWHAPRIFRAAVHAIEIAYGSLAATTLDGKEGA